MTSPIRHDLSDPAIPEGMVRINRQSSHRFIWPVHLAGWQSMGWQLQPEPEPTAPEEPEPTDPEEPEPEEPGEGGEEPGEGGTEPEPESELQKPDQELPEVEPEPEPLVDFESMTKAQIIEYCQSVYGVELDGSQTKAQLVEQAAALEASASAPQDDLLI